MSRGYCGAYFSGSLRSEFGAPVAPLRCPPPRLGITVSLQVCWIKEGRGWLVGCRSIQGFTKVLIRFGKGLDSDRVELHKYTLHFRIYFIYFYFSSKCCSVFF